MFIIYTDSPKIVKPKSGKKKSALEQLKTGVAIVDIFPAMLGLYRDKMSTNDVKHIPVAYHNIEVECRSNTQYPLEFSDVGFKSFKEDLLSLRNRIYHNGIKTGNHIDVDSFTITSVHFPTLGKEGFIHRESILKATAIISEVFDNLGIEVYIYA